MEKYRKLNNIVKFGSIDVVLAESEISHEYFVLKRTSKKDIADNMKNQLYKIYDTLTNFSHKNILKYHEYFETDKYLILVMDFADGGDLSQVIKYFKQKKRLIPEDIVIHYFRQIALGIQYLHNKKIIHRDLKPQNIFLKSEEIKVGDFDDIKVLETIHQSCTTRIGTYQYMSPEVISFKSYDYKTDIWSLGCILYELCTLETPFNVNGLASTRRAIEEGKYKPISKQYNKNIINLVKKMLSTKPRSRPNINQILSLSFLQPKSKILSPISQQEPEKPKFSFTDETIKLKLLILGSVSCGKSCLVDRFIFDKFDTVTKGLRIINKTKYFGDQMFDVQYSEGSEEHLNNALNIFYDMSDYAVIIFSVDDQNSYDNVMTFYEKIKSYKFGLGKIILCANKIDLERKVTFNQGIEMANKINAKYYEVSSKTGKEVDNMFNFIMERKLMSNL